MIYSQWRPDLGGFSYFETAETHNMNDDLPEPQLVPASKIGVPAIEAGRLIPSGARPAGTGSIAVGLVAPVDESRIVRRTRSLAGFEMSPTGWKWAAGLAAGSALAWYIAKRS